MADAVTLKQATLSYPHLSKPQPSSNGGPPKYSVTLVVIKDQLAPLEAAAREVAIEALGEKKGKAFQLYGGKGSAFRTDNAEKYPNIEAAITISARTDRKPGMVYRHADPASITVENPKGKPARVEEDKIEEVFYPGAVVNAQIKPFWYDRDGNKGVSWALNNLQKWSEGERLDSRVKAEDAFDADMSETPDELADVV